MNSRSLVIGFTVLLGAGAGHRAAAQQPLTVLAGHTHACSSAVFSPDGKLLVTGSFDKTLKIWDALAGTELRTLPGHANQVLTVAIHPGGRQLASGSRDNGIKLWDLFIPTPVQQFAGHTDSIHAVLVAPDRTWLATAGADMLVKLWNPADGKPLRDLAGHTSPVTRLALSKDGTQLASADSSGTVRLWNPQDGTSLGVFGADPTAIRGLAFHPTTATLLSAADNGSVKLWSLPPPAARTLDSQEAAVTAVASSPDASLLVTGGANASVKLFSSAAGTPARALAGQPGPVTTVALHAAAGLVVSGSETGIVKFWNAADGADRLTLAGHTGPIRDVAFNAAGDSLITAGEDGTLRLWRLPVAPRPLTGHTLPVAAVAASSDGKLIATGSADKTLGLFSSAGGAAIRMLTGSAPVRSLAFRADQAQLASGEEAGDVRLWDVAQGVPQGTLSGPPVPVTALVYLPDNQTLIAAGDDGSLRWWKVPPAAPRTLTVSPFDVGVAAFSADGTLAASGGLADGKPAIVVRETATGTLRATLLGHEAGVSSLAFSADKTKLISGSLDKTARVWNLADPKFPEIARFAGHAAAVTAVVLTADGQQAVSGSADNVLKHWQLADGQELRALAGHAGAVSSLALSGGVLVSGSADMTVRQWNLADGAPVRSLNHAAAVHSVAASPDGKWLASAGADNTIKLWNAADGTAVASLTGPAAGLAHVAFSADSTKLVGAGAAAVCTWNAAGQMLERFTLTDAPARAAVFLPDHTTVIAADARHALHALAASHVRIVAGHAGRVTGISLSADGTQLASCGADNKLKLWNTADGKLLFEVAIPEGAAGPVALRGDKLQLAASAPGGKIYLWPLTAQGAGQPVILTAPAAAAGLRFTADGTRLAAIHADQRLRLFDTADGMLLEDAAVADTPVDLALTPDGRAAITAGGNQALVHTLCLVRRISGHEGAVNTVQFTADSAGVISGGADKTVRLWTLADGKQVRTFAGATDAITDLAVAASGATLAAAGADKSVRVWNLADTAAAVQPTASISQESPLRGVSSSADGTRVVTSGDDGLVRVWDLATGRELERFSGHEGPVLSVAMAADGKSLVSAGADKTARLWAVSAQRVFVAEKTNVTDAAFLPNGSAVVTTGAEMLVKLWDAEGKPVRQLAGAKAPLTRLAIREDGVQAAAVDSAGRLMLWSVADGALQQTVETGAVVHDLSFSADLKKIAVAGGDNHVRVFQTDTGAPVQDQTAPAPQLAVRFTSGDLELVTGGSDKTVHVWTVASPAATGELAGHTGPVYCLAYSRDGKLLASGGGDATIRLWDLTTRQALRQLAGHTGAVYAVRFSADDKQLVSTGADGTVRQWNAADGAAVRSLAPMLAEGETPSPWYDLALSADGQWIAAAGQDQQIRSWNLANGQAAASWAGSDAIYRLEYLPDGQLLACGHAGNLALWNPANGMSVFTGKVPGVPYSACLSPVDKRVAIPCADGKVHFVTLP